MTTDTALDRHWSSRGLDSDHALVEARRLSSTAIVEAHITAFTDDYHFEWTNHRLDVLDINLLSVAPQRVRRTRAMCARSGTESFDILLVHRGTGTTLSRSGLLEFGQGDLLLLDSREPWDLTFSEGAVCFTMHAPAQWLRDRVDCPDFHSLPPVSRATAWSEPFVALLTLIAERGPDSVPTSRKALADLLGRLASLAFGTPQETAITSTPSAYGKVRAHIAAHFSDPFLTVESTAQALGVSRRTVHKVLAAQGEDFRKLLEEARLEKARMQLRSLLGAHVSIGEVAWQCGFADQGYFARRFKVRFGTSPSIFRQGH